jgi:hypothetical protein
MGGFDFRNWNLVIGAYLGFASLPVGREIGYWNLINNDASGTKGS